VILLAACNRPIRPQESAETCITEYIKAVHSADIATMRRLTATASQMPETMAEEDIRIAQRIVPVGFVSTNVVVGSTNAMIEGTATYRDGWNTNTWAEFRLIFEDDRWKYESHLIDVDDDVNPMTE